MAKIAFRSKDLVPTKANGPAAKMVIAIDGPAGSGKSTLAQRIASRLGYAHLNTGALYRAVALGLVEYRGDADNEKDVKAALDIVLRNLTPELLSNPALRSEEVTQAASKVASYPFVRDGLLEYQRNFAKNPPEGTGGVVLDGRDIGTVVCPNADVKLFVTASAEIRAKRRTEEITGGGGEADYSNILKDIRSRDERDSSREASPLKSARDAYVLDTSAMDATMTLDQALALIRARLIEATAEH